MKELEHLKRWKRPSNYMGAQWPEWYVFLGRNRDSDCLTNSNFETGFEAVKAASTVTEKDDEDIRPHIVSENHWAVGWVEWIAIHESDEAALELADSLLAKLENYPVLDENDWSEREMEEANTVWRDCYRPHERIEYIRKHRFQFEFADFSDMLNCVRGKYFAGYASELIQ